MGDKKEGKQTNHSTVARVDAARLHEYKFKTFKYFEKNEDTGF